MTLDDIVSRCSKFSGWSLTWEIEDGAEDGALHIFDPKDSGKSRLTVSLVFPDRALLRERYGRLRHWAITREEELVMAKALGYVEHPKVPVKMVDPTTLTDY